MILKLHNQYSVIQEFLELQLLADRIVLRKRTFHWVVLIYLLCLTKKTLINKHELQKILGPPLPIVTETPAFVPLKTCFPGNTIFSHREKSGKNSLSGSFHSTSHHPDNPFRIHTRPKFPVFNLLSPVASLVLVSSNFSLLIQTKKTWKTEQQYWSTLCYPIWNGTYSSIRRGNNTKKESPESQMLTYIQIRILLHICMVGVHTLTH